MFYYFVVQVFGMPPRAACACLRLKACKDSEKINKNVNSSWIFLLIT